MLEINKIIDRVIYNPPFTIVYFIDGAVGVSQCNKHETFDPEKGFSFAVLNRIFGHYFWDDIQDYLPKR